MNLKAMLENTAKHYADKTAIVMGERRITYAELDRSANKVAHALLQLGVVRGDRVALMLANSPEFVICYFGSIKAGAIPTPLDIRHKSEELARLLHNCQPKVLIIGDSLLEPVIPALSRFHSIKHIINVGATHDGNFLSYQTILTTSPASAIDREPAPDDLATISYAGGPTAHPHGAMLTHRCLAAAADSYAAGFRQTDRDVSMLFSLPMYHMLGLASVLLASIARGSTVVIVPGTGRSIGSFFETVEKERGTIFLAVPYIYALAVNVARREGITSDLSSLRLCVSGGAPLPLTIIHQFQQYYGFNIIDVWGLTEAVAHVTCSADGTSKLGSTGKVLPGWEIKVVDDDGTGLPPNQPGEILVKGLITRGYYHNPQATAAIIRDNWLQTGDIGKIDEEGYLYITGRKKEMIIFKGENIYPGDIEQVLCDHPKVDRARVTGIPDELRGETIRAFIVLKQGETVTETEIRKFCQPRLADYKLPREIVFTDVLPPPSPSQIWG